MKEESLTYGRQNKCRGCRGECQCYQIMAALLNVEKPIWLSMYQNGIMTVTTAAIGMPASLIYHFPSSPLQNKVMHKPQTEYC